MKQTIEFDLKWYETRQNNSGGSFTVDDKVAHFVIVQAPSARIARQITEDITEESGQNYCECCGERWYISFDDDDGTDEPTIYGKSMEEYTPYFKDEVRLHYYSGVIETVKLTEK